MIIEENSPSDEGQLRQPFINPLSSAPSGNLPISESASKKTSILLIDSQSVGRINFNASKV